MRCGLGGGAACRARRAPERPASRAHRAGSVSSGRAPGTSTAKTRTSTGSRGARPAREQLAIMKMETTASLASTMALTELVAKIDGNVATDDDLKLHRFLVNANKYVTSITATDVVHRAIEVLGGNGTIEDFSPLPRLYRDSIVFESWEGTHNVLCDQVRRDCARLGLLDVVGKWIHGGLDRVQSSSLIDVDLIRSALDEITPGLTKSVADDESSNFRRQLTRLVRIIQATCLLRSNPTVSSALVRIHLAPHASGEDPTWLPFLDAVLG